MGRSAGGSFGVFVRNWTSPQRALTLLENNFLKLATVIALTAKSYETLLLSAPKNNVAGGRTYDAVNRVRVDGFDF